MRKNKSLAVSERTSQCPGGEQQTDPNTAGLYHTLTNPSWGSTRELCSCLWQNCRRQAGRAAILSRQELQGVARHRPREEFVLHT